MKKKRIFSSLLSLLAIFFLGACQVKDAEEPEEKMTVITSFFPVYDFTKEIAGDQADVTMMIDGGMDPHSYEPSAQDIAKLTHADLFVYTSEVMEYWVSGVLNSIDNEELIVARTGDALENEDHYEQSPVESSEGETVNSVSDVEVTANLIGVAGHYHTGDVVTLRVQFKGADHWQWFVKAVNREWELVADLTEDRFEYETTGQDFYVQAVALDGNGNELAQSEAALIHIDDHEEQDPHIWLDPVLAQEQVRIIRDALIEADPEGEAEYQENAEEFIASLQELHKEYEAAFAEAENRTFIVQHQAFGYIASRYHLNQIAIGGLSAEVEPSPSRIAEITQLVKEYAVPVIYYQQGANSSIAQTVANETNTEVAVLHDLETVSRELQSEGFGYIEAMHENLESLKLSIH
ncbi:MAG TPA: zinc ABC transporter substrate-binding protein [Candidatus Jeotgalibaca pullicola]|nr:zinc ABC transporter substrate-binding protein [Candidatus Jeotgalibaca pullicola]